MVHVDTQFGPAFGLTLIAERMRSEGHGPTAPHRMRPLREVVPLPHVVVDSLSMVLTAHDVTGWTGTSGSSRQFRFLRKLIQQHKTLTADGSCFPLPVVFNPRPRKGQNKPSAPAPGPNPFPTSSQGLPLRSSPDLFFLFRLP